MLQESYSRQLAKIHATVATIAGLFDAEQRADRVQRSRTSAGQCSASSPIAALPEPAASARDVMICAVEPHGLSLQLSLDALGLRATSCAGWSQAVEEALLAAPPECILVDCKQRGLSLCREIRAMAALAQLKVIALVNDPWSGEVQQAMAAGVDDYLPVYQLERLGAKLRALAEYNPPPARSRFGKAVIADPDRDRRIQLGRAVQRLGLDVVFALDAAVIADDGSVQLVVANEGLLDQALAARPGCNSPGAGAPTPWIICGTSSALHQARERLGSDRPLGFYDLDTDPSQLVFIANTLLCEKGAHQRSSKRLLYEGPVRLEQQGEESWGFLYNINRGGLYVRTLTPPPRGTRLALEFQPPFGRGRVLVDGQVVWRQAFSGGAGNHPGCRIAFLDLPLADAAALAAGYDKLLETSGEFLQ